MICNLGVVGSNPTRGSENRNIVLLYCKAITLAEGEIRMFFIVNIKVLGVHFMVDTFFFVSYLKKRAECFTTFAKRLRKQRINNPFSGIVI